MIDEAQPILIFQQNQDDFTGQNKNAVPCKYSFKGNANKTSVSFAFDCRCHMSIPPPLTSLKTAVLPVLHAAVSGFTSSTLVMCVREAKQQFQVVKSELFCIICAVAFHSAKFTRLKLHLCSRFLP